VLNVRKLKLDRDRRGPGTGGLALTGFFQPARPIAPDSSDAVRVELRHGADVMFSAALDHPSSDPFWRRRKRLVRYTNRRNALGSVMMQTQPAGVVRFDIRGRHLTFTGLDPAVSSRLIVGSQCFVADLTGACTLDAKKLRCRR
jgi:hypothetical protein